MKTILSKLDQIQQALQIQNLIQKKALSLSEAATYMDVSESFMYKLTHKAEVTFSKPHGKKIYFLREDLDEFMLRNQQEAIIEEEFDMNSLFARKRQQSN